MTAETANDLADAFREHRDAFGVGITIGETEITAIVAEAGANVDEVHHQRAFTLLAAQNVSIELVLQTRGREHIAEVIRQLQAQGFEAALV
jgi:hypothetical protein